MKRRENGVLKDRLKVRQNIAGAMLPFGQTSEKSLLPGREFFVAEFGLAIVKHKY